MADVEYEVVGIRAETPSETRMREWFEQQALASPDTLEKAARLLVGLIAGLITLLFSVFTVTEATLPAYMRLAGVRGLAMGAILALLVALIAGLLVVMPQYFAVASGQPGQMPAEFDRILTRKARALTVATSAFGVGVTLLGGALLFVLWVTR